MYDEDTVETYAQFFSEAYQSLEPFYDGGFGDPKKHWGPLADNWLDDEEAEWISRWIDDLLDWQENGELALDLEHPGWMNPLPINDFEAIYLWDDPIAQKLALRSLLFPPRMFTVSRVGFGVDTIPLADSVNANPGNWYWWVYTDETHPFESYIGAMAEADTQFNLELLKVNIEDLQDRHGIFKSLLLDDTPDRLPPYVRPEYAKLFFAESPYSYWLNLTEFIYFKEFPDKLKECSNPFVQIVLREGTEWERLALTGHRAINRTEGENWVHSCGHHATNVDLLLQCIGIPAYCTGLPGHAECSLQYSDVLVRTASFDLPDLFQYRGIVCTLVPTLQALRIWTDNPKDMTIGVDSLPIPSRRAFMCGYWNVYIGQEPSQTKVWLYRANPADVERDFEYLRWVGLEPATPER